MNRTKINKQANKELKKLFIEKGITHCEICHGKCTDFGLSFAHRHKRAWYYDKPVELLWDFKQVILCCVFIHDGMERSAKITEKEFMKLRGDE
jgi:hypothetical protein